MADSTPGVIHVHTMKRATVVSPLPIIGRDASGIVFSGEHLRNDPKVEEELAVMFEVCFKNLELWHSGGQSKYYEPISGEVIVDTGNGNICLVFKAILGNPVADILQNGTREQH